MRVSYIPGSSPRVQHHHRMSKLYIYLYIYMHSQHHQSNHTNKILYIRSTYNKLMRKQFTAAVLPGTTSAHPNRSVVPAWAAAGPPMVSLFGPRDAGGPFAACGTATSRQEGTGWEAAHWEEGRWWGRWLVCACWRRDATRRSSNLSANNKQQRGEGE